MEINNKIKVSISIIALKEKPNEKDIGRIKNSFEEKECTLSEILHKVINGYSIAPAIFKENHLSKENWKEQQMIMLDFDSGIKKEDVINRLKQDGITPNFSYNTFSNTNEKPRFRIGLILSEPIENESNMENILKAFKHIFPETDTNCLESARMFYGGTYKDLINFHFININTFLDYINPYIISNDSYKNRKIVQKGVSHIYNNSNTPFQTKNDNYLKYLKNNKKQNVDFNNLRSKIKILNDFIEGEWLYHPQLLGLATNLVHLKGGEKLYKKTIKNHNKNGKTQYGEEKLAIITYVKKQKYYPQNLKDFSPYEQDHQYTNIVFVNRKPNFIEKIEEHSFITLSQAEEKFNNEFNKVINSKDEKIYLFKISTGLGKTEKILDLEETVLGFPNHNLKEEVGVRIKDKSDLIFNVYPRQISFENEEFNNDLKVLYAKGLNGEAFDYIRNIARIQSGASLTEIIRASIYIEQIDKIRDKTGTTLMTHTKALQGDFLHDLVVYDEDPIQNLLKIKFFKIEDLRALNSQINNDNDDSLTNFLNTLNNKDEIGLARKTPLELFLFFNGEEQEIKNIIRNSNIKTDLISFFKSSYYLIDKNDCNKVYYVVQNDFCNKKNIILSASPQIYLYKKLLGDRLEIIDVSNVQLKGKLIEDTSHSCSRSSLNNHTLQEKLKEQIGDKPTLTFMNKKELFQNSQKNMHFGNSMGYDELKGKDMAVVGTPHLNEATYRLYGMCAGINSNGDELQQRRIDYNGFRFNFTTFENKDMQKIQLELIEAEIIQAVGRARLIREECEVQLFSNLPIAGAEFVESKVKSGNQLDRCKKVHIKSLKSA